MSDELARSADARREQVDDMRKAEKEGEWKEDQSARKTDMLLKGGVDVERDEEWEGGFPQYRRLPEHMRKGAKRYVEEGKRPGGFLNAVLCNNLALAYRLADSDNRYILHVYAEWLYNDIPNLCWGSRQVVFNWIKSGGLNSRKEEG